MRRVYKATAKGRRALAAARSKVRELFGELIERGQEEVMDAVVRARTHREFLLAAGVGSGLWLSGCDKEPAMSPGGGGAGLVGGPEEEVSPNEDLMREHGVLDRVLLVYEEAMRRRP